MKWLFWLSLLLVAYAYAGYPAWLWLRSRWASRPVRKEPIRPAVSIVMAVHNEAETLPRKLDNLASLNYPADLYEVIVVSDGSTDGTNELLTARAHERLHAIVLPEHAGKAVALNRGIEAARGEIIVFTDVRQWLEPECLEHLIQNFADPTVGCVSGELMLRKPESATPIEGVGLYWRMEKKIRQWEGQSGSLVGATGALYAVRKNLVVTLPPGTILDDAYLPLHVVRQGARVVFEPEARAWDETAASATREFRRKVRTLTGNYQLLQLAPWVLSGANPLRFEFVSHKLLRLLVPFALAGLLVSTALLPGRVYQVLLLLQSLFYGIGALVISRPSLNPVGRLGNMAVTFLVLNAAAVMALVHFVSGKKQVWVR